MEVYALILLFSSNATGATTRSRWRKETIGLYTGMRRGEIPGLRRGRVDMAASTRHSVESDGATVSYQHSNGIGQAKASYLTVEHGNAYSCAG